VLCLAGYGNDFIAFIQLVIKQSNIAVILVTAATI
jgi:hypothetical protein